MSKIKVLNTEMDIDFLDADVLEKIEKGCEKVVEESKKNRMIKMKMSEAIKKECEVIRNFLDFVFGEGIAQKIFGNRYSLTEALEVFEVITNERMKQSETLEKMNKKYSVNRAQRRSK